MDENCLQRITPRPRLKTLVVNICDHCNLNCKGCDHFSPIAEQKYYDVDEIVDSVSQLRKIIDDSVNLISVMGGEPLLHPELPKILESIRHIFPNTEIWLSTNGTLLLTQSDTFWNILKESDICINVTKYPIEFDYDSAEGVARSNGVRYQYYHGGTVEKTMGHYPIDLEGKQDPTDSFLRCFHANNTCNMLQHGRLYTCTIAPCIPIFCNKFGYESFLTDDDGIDIYAVKDKYELFSRLARPMNMCRFCDVKNRSFGHKWETSKGEITEWTM